ncbi:MAG TPA: hypothetical protein PLV81_13860 [Spirochaetota bacterium]|nr:hypothetical protein [Spirochaetota bacterium]
MVTIFKRGIAVIVIAGVIGAWGCKPKEPKGEKNAVPPEITQFVDALFQAIVNEDIEYIEKVLYDGEIEYDYNEVLGDYIYKPKSDIIKEIRNKGKTYYELFDTERLIEYIAKYRCSDGKGNPCTVENIKLSAPYIQSVKEKILSRKNIRVEKIEVIDKEKNIIRCHLIDDYEIEMKKKSPLSEMIFLKKVDIIKNEHGIYLYSLFFDVGPIVED